MGEASETRVTDTQCLKMGAVNRLEEIRGRLEAAPPGPWGRMTERIEAEEDPYVPTYWVWDLGAGEEEILAGTGLDDPTGVLELVAHAPSDIAALLAVAEAAAEATCVKWKVMLDRVDEVEDVVQLRWEPCGTCWGCQLRAALAPLTQEEET